MNNRTPALYSFLDACKIRVLFKLTKMGKHWKGLSTPRYADHSRFTRRDVQKHPLLMVPPSILQEFARAVFRYVRVVVWLFILVSSYVLIMSCSLKIFKNPYFSPQFWRLGFIVPSEKNCTIAAEKNVTLWRKQTCCSRELQEISGGHSEEAIGGFDRPAE